MSDDKQVVPTQSFEERMKARIRDGIGDMMTDDELATIVRKGVEDAFFKPGTETRGYTAYSTPSLIHGIVKELLSDSIKQHAATYIAEHQDVVLAAIVDGVKLTAGDAILRAVSERFSSEMYSFVSGIQSNLQRK